MERSSYQLRIDVEENYYDQVSSIVGLYPESYKLGWSYEIILEEQKEYFDIIIKFLDSLEGKYEKLHELGIGNNNITVWLIYGYNNQCNMEFRPSTLERLGNKGIKLCISCYEAGTD